MFALWSRAQRKSRNREYKNSLIFSRFFFSHRNLRTIANTIVIVGRRSITSGTRFHVICCLVSLAPYAVCFNLIVYWLSCDRVTYIQLLPGALGFNSKRDWQQSLPIIYRLHFPLDWCV
ncbi:hypothetical protein FOVG_14412 [Fusarium oxysporum f. sp. pisi HDV247]|uniref:Uncharacterized protein n=1 Tax=Fusarium oxysporum f. sp. pisi HDV247 TaxID=1080344 RepID=W9NNT6_FUSOX|nr:hypothetical protein FOVG_14412 [Fusarium oxysporum f. sp. pisi HDV247]